MFGGPLDVAVASVVVAVASVVSVEEAGADVVAVAVDSPAGAGWQLRQMADVRPMWSAGKGLMPP